MNNQDSILTSIKKLLGIQEDYTHFDTDIIIHINSVFLTLQQLGIGPKQGFFITDDTNVWTDFTSEGTVLNSTISYMYLKVKMLFDPPISSYVVDANNRIIAELEWRIMAAADPENIRMEETQNGK